ncbi:MAG TPA: hypothetical protein VG148_02030 [Pyrinomonadaceae bacterium]|nr:hypothetical protein [Pyrinomonadaceae bacterium]
MPTPSNERLLDELERLKRPGGSRARLRGLLARLGRREFTTAGSLIRFHELLLFLRAYPRSPALLAQSEKLLGTFRRRVERLRAAGAEDLAELERPEVSGVAGTSFPALFSYHVVRWLAARFPSRVRLDWEGYEEAGQLAAVLPRFLPFLEENAYVESYFPFREWLRAARARKQNELAWLLRRFERLDVAEEDAAALFDLLRLWVRWELDDSPLTRTRLRRRPSRGLFYHDAPLLTRRDVSLAAELADETPLPVEKLARAAGERLLDAGRATMAMRYRELHGFTHGDPSSVLRAEAGRGLEIFLWGVPPGRRLPTLAYHVALLFKNGVPCGYAEALTLFERAEAGLNLFYTFRDGESAWVYARLLRVFRQALGARVFSVDPYQLGHLNEEGLRSGAFWFYRKLGFRPVSPRLLRMVEAEERKLAARPGHRSSERVLRELSSGHVLFEPPSAARGEWDRFHVRNLGLAVARRMGARHGGDDRRMRRAATASVSRALGLDASRWREDERRAFERLAPLLALVPGLPRWTDAEKQDLARLLRAKAGRDELDYLRRLQSHARLRREIIRLGSTSSSQ